MDLRTTSSPADNTDQDDVVALVRAGGNEALADAFHHYRPRLEQLVRFRLDQRLLGRVDPADVLQEAYLEIARRFDSYAARPAVSFYVWLRQITWQTLLTIHRRHLGPKRNAGQELLLAPQGSRQSSNYLSQLLAASLTSPSQAAMRDENLSMLRQAIDQLATIDREILVLRHFEQLSNAKVAEVLGLSPTAASNRYIRALRRLRQVLGIRSQT